MPDLDGPPELVWPGYVPATELSADLIPWDRPFLTWKGPDYVPTEAFSPSGLETWMNCERLGAYRYVWGIREFEFTWEMMQGRPKPSDPNKRYQAQLTKIYNKRRGPALGKATHAILEQHNRYLMAGPHSVQSSEENWRAQWQPGCEPKPVSKAQWDSTPGKVALSGLHLLPAREHFAWVDIEGQISLDSSIVAPEIEPIQFNGYRDLFAKFYDGSSELTDYKSYNGNEFQDETGEKRTSIRRPAELMLHPQPNIYSLDVMEWQNTIEQWCNWVYFRTQGAPHAEAVQFVITRKHAERQVRRLALFADSIRAKLRARLEPDEYPANIFHCDKYGGCSMHHTRGGPCTATQSFGARLASLGHAHSVSRQSIATPTTQRKRDTMGFREERQAFQQNGGQVNDQSSDNMNAPEHNEQQEGGFIEADGGQQEQQPPPRRGRPPGGGQQRQAAPPPQRQQGGSPPQGRAPRGQAPQQQQAPQGAPPPQRRAPRGQQAAPPQQVGADDNSIVVVFGGNTRISVSEGTPLYDKLGMLYRANFG